MINKTYDFCRSLISISFILLCSISYLHSQDNRIKFSNLTTKEGLSQSSVVSMFQDDEGFLWFGTYGGLNRFDGYNFLKYQYTKNNPISICDNHVRSIIQDTTGVLWVATVGGLNHFFSHTKEFIHYVHNPNDSTSLAHNTIYKILKDRDGGIWLGTWGGGLEKMEKKIQVFNDERKTSYNFIHHKPDASKNSISSLWITDIAEGPDGSLWIATNNGLNKYDKKNKQFTIYKNDPNNINSLNSNDISAVCVDNTGKIWVGTWGSGLNILDPKSNEISRYRYSKNDFTSISHDIIMKIYCDKSGNIWLGTWGGGLDKAIYKKPNGLTEGNNIEFIRYQHSELDIKSISSNSIYSMMEDNTGIMWVGTDWGGINKFEKEVAKFGLIQSQPGNSHGLSNNVVFSLLIDRNNLLWIGTQEGLNIYNRQTGQFSLFLNEPGNENSLSHNLVRSMIEDKDGNVWLGTLSGLNKYSIKSKQFKRYIIDITNPSFNNVLALFYGSDNSIWIGSYGAGLLRLDPETEKLISYKKDSRNPKGISDEIVWSIVEDKDKNIWIGTYDGGIIKYDRKADEFYHYVNDSTDSTSLSNNYVLSLFIDHQGTLWAGTALGLNKLLKINGNKAEFKSYYMKDGLAAQTINGIVEDNQNNLWITTSQGLSRLDPATNYIKSFGLDDGIQDVEFSINAIIKDKKTGEVFAGGIKGFNYFKPELIRNNTIPPIVKIVDLKLFNKSVSVRQLINNKIILDQYISSLNELKLSYKENVISFEFAALQYHAPEENQYAFKMEGFDKDWNYVKNQRIATYTNLPPAKYTFMVKAANNDGVWNETPTKLTLYITPPWWKTTLFRLAVSLIIISSILYYYWLRMKIMQQRQRHLENMVIKRTEELSEANVMLEEKQEEISLQNEELLNHRYNLENLVENRTSELKAAKIKAEESERLKSSFLANMSHEVRTPMNAIIGFSNLLEDETLDKEEKSYFINMIKNNGSTLLTLIDDILDISLIEAKQLVLYKEVFSLDEILKEIYSYYTLRNTKDIRIEIIHNQQLNHTIYNDPVRFRQIMNNLVGNAIKYTETGYIKFGYLIENEYIKIFVKDTGIGINSEDINKIFDYFYKAESSETKLYQGTGIGLSICKKLVESMGGTIWVESEPGKGSSFYFTLPNVSSVQSEKILSASVEKKINLNDLNVLVAEDEPNNFFLVERILRKTGCSIIWAKNGKEAVECVSKFEKDKKYLVLMDIKMPIMNGIEANRQIKALKKDIPVIAVTAYAQATDRTKIMKENFDNYLSKPINANKLIEMITMHSLK